MKRLKSASRGHPTIVVLMLLLALVLVISLAGIATAAKPDPGPPSSGTETWKGHGSEHMTTDAGQYHWVLTA